MGDWASISTNRFRWASRGSKRTKSNKAILFLLLIPFYFRYRDPTLRQSHIWLLSSGLHDLSSHDFLIIIFHAFSSINLKIIIINKLWLYNTIYIYLLKWYKTSVGVLKRMNEWILSSFRKYQCLRRRKRKIVT